MTRTATLPGVDGVLGYLRQKFDRVDGHETPSGSLSIEVRDGGENWHLNVSEEFLGEHGPEEARRLLEDWNVAGEMRRAEGLGLSVSSAGVRLDSSN